jgi:hypothetical protein
MRQRPSSGRPARQAGRGAKDYPIATIAYYGPDDRRATKAVVGIAKTERREIVELRKWFGESGDLRKDAVVASEIEQYLQSHGVRRVVLGDGILGCPHEEGIDYPLNADCPECPYWAGRERPI